jgi:hypothetical protein
MSETLEVQKHRFDLDATQIYNTTDYDIFRKKDGNRAINAQLVNKLYNSIIENGYYDISIIVIGEDMSVLDGQHRLAALKMAHEETGIDYKIKYVVSSEFDDLKKIISWQKDRSSWTTNDYAESYAEMGNEHYQAYLDFREKYKLNHTLGHLLLKGKQIGKAEHFKRGDFKVEDYDRAEDWALRLQSIATYYDFAYNRNFVKAMVQYWNHPKFSHVEFMAKVDMFRTLIFNCLNVKEFSGRISELYNYRQKTKIKFEFKK